MFKQEPTVNSPIHVATSTNLQPYNLEVHPSAMYGGCGPIPMPSYSQYHCLEPIRSNASGYMLESKNQYNSFKPYHSAFGTHDSQTPTHSRYDDNNDSGANSSNINQPFSFRSNKHIKLSQYNEDKSDNDLFLMFDTDGHPEGVKDAAAAANNNSDLVAYDHGTAASDLCLMKHLKVIGSHKTSPSKQANLNSRVRVSDHQDEQPYRDYHHYHHHHHPQMTTASLCSRSSYMCRKCKTHGQNIPVKRHKRACPYMNCICLKCRLVDQGRKVVARQIALYRDQKSTTNHHVSDQRSNWTTSKASNKQSTSLAGTSKHAKSASTMNIHEMVSEMSSCEKSDGLTIVDRLNWSKMDNPLTGSSLDQVEDGDYNDHDDDDDDDEEEDEEDDEEVAGPTTDECTMKNASVGPHCRRCRNHSIAVTWKGHKKICPFRNCPCDPCRLINVRKDTEKTLREMVGNQIDNLKTNILTSITELNVNVSVQKLTLEYSTSPIHTQALPSPSLTASASSSLSSICASSLFNSFASSILSNDTLSSSKPSTSDSTLVSMLGGSNGLRTDAAASHINSPLSGLPFHDNSLNRSSLLMTHPTTIQSPSYSNSESFSNNSHYDWSMYSNNTDQQLQLKQISHWSNFKSNRLSSSSAFATVPTSSLNLITPNHLRNAYFSTKQFNLNKNSTTSVSPTMIPSTILWSDRLDQKQPIMEAKLENHDFSTSNNPSNQIHPDLTKTYAYFDNFDHPDHVVHSQADTFAKSTKASWSSTNERKMAACMPNATNNGKFSNCFNSQLIPTEAAFYCPERVSAVAAAAAAAAAMVAMTPSIGVVPNVHHPNNCSHHYYHHHHHLYSCPCTSLEVEHDKDSTLSHHLRHSHFAKHDDDGIAADDNDSDPADPTESHRLHHPTTALSSLLNYHESSNMYPLNSFVPESYGLANTNQPTFNLPCSLEDDVQQWSSYQSRVPYTSQLKSGHLIQSNDDNIFDDTSRPQHVNLNTDLYTNQNSDYLNQTWRQQINKLNPPLNECDYDEHKSDNGNYSHFNSNELNTMIHHHQGQLTGGMPIDKADDSPFGSITSTNNDVLIKTELNRNIFQIDQSSVDGIYLSMTERHTEDSCNEVLPA